MDFEEFFRKKKIDLVAFEQGEPALFSEFKIHYERMGEKSFDHTKKYWFNKLRLRFHTQPEVKAEKVTIENPLAEQTITESLIESSIPSPNIGFKPKFKAPVTKPAEEVPLPKEETTSPAPNVGFKPRFKAGVTKPAEQAAEPKEEITSPAPAPTVGFKPRFKAGVTKPAEEAAKTEPVPAPEKAAENTEQASPPPNIGFKPRFKAGVTKPAEPVSNTEPVPVPDNSAENTEQAPPPAPLGFKPKFKAGVTKTVAPEPEEELKTDEAPKEDQPGETKPAYKPRFNMKNIKPKGEE